MGAVRDTIRASADPNVKFAPIILFADDCDFESYLGFVRMGFDDILTLPDKRQLLINRLEAQINAEHTYLETSTYLGPDRRRMEAIDHVDPRRGTESYSHIKYTIRRTLDEGSEAIKTEIFASRRLKPTG